MRRRMAGGLAVVCLAVSGCASAAIPAARTNNDAAMRVIDEPCSAANVALSGPTRLTSFDPIEFPVPARWIPNFATINDLDFNLQKTRAVLHVWKGSEFIFKPVLPINTVQCELTRGDTTIKIRSTMEVEGITSYRVDVTWEPQVGGQHLYMQLITRFPEHLKQIRGVVEGVRFPVRAASNQ